MGEREAIALRKEGQATHGGRRGPAFHDAGGVAGAGDLAGRPRQRSAAQRHGVDPASLFVGNELGFAGRRGRDQTAVVAARQQPLAIVHGAKDGGVGVSGETPLVDHDLSVRERER